MAFHGNKAGAANTWVELSDSEAISGSVRVHNASGYDVTLQATNGGTDPASTAGGIGLRPGETFVGTLAEYFPGVSGADRLWCYSPLAATLSVSYA